MSEDEAWVRQQLAALPAPALPDDVRSRLDAAIAAETSAGASSPAAAIPAETSAGASPPAAAIPSQRRSSGRRILLSLASAAAALTLFAVMDPLSLTGLDSTPSDESALAPAGAGDAITDEADRGQDLTQAKVARAMIATETSYTNADLAVQARSAAAASGDSAAAPAEPTTRPSTASDDPVVEAAAACVAAIPDAAGDLVVVDRATFEGQPALVVVLRSGTTFDVVVQDPTCTLADPAIKRRVTVEAPPGE